MAKSKSVKGHYAQIFSVIHKRRGLNPKRKYSLMGN